MVFTLLQSSSLTLADSDILTRPKALRQIGEEAFYRNTATDRVILPNGVEEIGSRAFSQSTLTEIVLPDSLAYIADDAFDSSLLQDVKVNSGTYAYRWAVEHGYFPELDEASLFS